MAQNHRRYRENKPIPFTPSQSESTQINEGAFSYYSSLQKVKDYVELHHSEGIPLQTAAKIASLESKYFSAFFHRKVGVTYKHWLTSVQIANAKRLIMIVDNPLTHIASAVGFRDLRTFERAFKKHTGQTPIKFKKFVRPS